jgi:transposase
MRSLSEQTRQDVVSQLLQGKSVRKVAENLGIGKSSVQRIRSQRVKDLLKSRGGRSSKLSVQAKRFCINKITSGKLKSSVSVKKALENDLGVKVSVSTVKRALYDAGLGGIKKLEKPLLSSKNVKERLNFAKAHQYWTVDDWRRVIFSDETKINRFGSDGCKWAWIRDGETVQNRHVKQTVKHGGGSIMILGCMTAQGAGYMCKIDTIMDQHLYRSILEDEFVKTIEWYGLVPRDVIFQQDNDPKHKAKSVQNWLQNQEFDVLSWPSQSPDLNPIEHLWAKVKRDLNGYDTPPSGILDLWGRVQEVWNRIKPEECLNLIDSMPRRIQAVIKAKGKWTKY